ncbi:MAG: hypothetical protein IKA23_00855, partial [Akkermansia sp.]|nr:hypothetical protein [Akkermansia sp.]
QGFRLRPAGHTEKGTPWARELTAPPVGGAQNSARLRLAKVNLSVTTNTDNTSIFNCLINNYLFCCNPGVCNMIVHNVLSVIRNVNPCRNEH